MTEAVVEVANRQTIDEWAAEHCPRLLDMFHQIINTYTFRDKSTSTFLVKTLMLCVREEALGGRIGPQP